MNIAGNQLSTGLMKWELDWECAEGRGVVGGEEYAKN